MNNNQSQKPDKLENDQQKINAAIDLHLNAEVDNLDFNVTSKLMAARQRALSQEAPASAKVAGRPWLNWQPIAGATAALGVALVVGNQLYSPGDVTLTPAPSQVASSELIEDLPILSASDDFEFYQSIEFLEWMESNSG